MTGQVESNLLMLIRPRIAAAAHMSRSERSVVLAAVYKPPSFVLLVSLSWLFVYPTLVYFSWYVPAGTATAVLGAGVELATVLWT